jgi:hypothetical protein
MIKQYQDANQRIEWTKIGLFYLIACVVAFPFNTGRVSYTASRYLPGNLGYVPAALGLALAATLFWGSLGEKAKVTLTGGYLARSLLFCLTPMAAFTVVGMQHGGGADPHLFGLLYSAINLVYAIMEEAGWRGYLQNATRPLSDLRRFLITGLLWWPWHMRFAGAFDWFVFPLIVLASAVGLGKIAEQTRSFLVSAGLHLLIILLSNTGGDWNRKLAALGMCLGVWAVILRGWMGGDRLREK